MRDEDRDRWVVIGLMAGALAILCGWLLERLG
jgi:hypothetical protein